MRSRAKIIVGVTLIAVFAVGIIVAARLVIFNVMVKGETLTEAIGGQWHTETWHSPMSHSGEGAVLFYGSGSSARRVAELVYTIAYLGDDCVAYLTYRGPEAPSCWAACGDRPPVLVVPSGYPGCQVTPQGVSKPTSGGRPAINLHPGELRSLAHQQP